MPNIKRTITPDCPQCGHFTSVHKNLASGSTQYRCRNQACKHIFTPDAKPSGGKPKYGDQPLTDAQRQALYRARKKGRAS